MINCSYILNTVFKQLSFLFIIFICSMYSSNTKANTIPQTTSLPSQASSGENNKELLVRRGNRGGGAVRRPSAGHHRSAPRPQRPHTRPEHRPGKPDHRPVQRPNHDRHYYHGDRRWIRYTGVIPATAAILYYRGGVAVYSCQVEYKGALYTGTFKHGEPCYVTINGKTMSFSNFGVRSD